MSKDPQSRKWQITVNNPVEKGFDHERIKNELKKLKSAIYWCMADEIGLKQETPHTHIYIACTSGVKFSRLCNIFCYYPKKKYKVKKVWQKKKAKSKKKYKKNKKYFKTTAAHFESAYASSQMNTAI